MTQHVKVSTKSKLSFLFQRVSVRSEAFPINRNQNTQIKLRRGGVYLHKISLSVPWHNDLSIVYSALFIYFILLLFLPKRSIKNHYSIGSAMPPFWQLTLSGKKYINTLVDGRTQATLINILSERFFYLQLWVKLPGILPCRKKSGFKLTANQNKQPLIHKREQHRKMQSNLGLN